jgi:hypothetical protein
LWNWKLSFWMWGRLHKFIPSDYRAVLGRGGWNDVKRSEVNSGRNDCSIVGDAHKTFSEIGSFTDQGKSCDSKGECRQTHEWCLYRKAEKEEPQRENMRVLESWTCDNRVWRLNLK